tara:strand:+ start:2815 stop:2961 length:147 start_codon:yes stop_codon:yes gene_type:complete
MPKCCDNEDNLEWIREGGLWPYEIWGCKSCESEYNVELIRDFSNKEKR